MTEPDAHEDDDVTYTLAPQYVATLLYDGRRLHWKHMANLALERFASDSTIVPDRDRVAFEKVCAALEDALK